MSERGERKILSSILLFYDDDGRELDLLLAIHLEAQGILQGAFFPVDSL